MRTAVSAGLVLILTLCAASPALAQSAENVAVVINDNSGASQLIGNYYVKQRRIPPSNVFHIKAPTDEAITRDAYDAGIERPLAAAIARENLQDRILYIVLTKGVPLRIEGSGGVAGTTSSVDSELTLLYRRMAGLAAPPLGRIQNPYFLGDRDIRDARHFTHRDYDIYLVVRLDAFTAEEAIELVDAAQSASTEGAIVLDEREALTNATGDHWLAAAAERARKVAPARQVVLETTPRPATASGPVLGYASWGGTDPELHRRNVGLQFAKGSIALTLAGADARTLQAPPPDWTPMKAPRNPATWFGGSPQSLLGDLIREGATGAAGSVAEPFLQGTPRPDIAIPAYLAGFNLAEAFYLATPFLSWQTVVIGDPLCGPLVTAPVPGAALTVETDASTELPALFSARRLAVVKAAMKSGQDVAPLLLRAEARLARGDRTGARTVLLQAAAAAPDLPGPQLQLAMLDDAAGSHDSATNRYRQVLQLQPENVVALNNLAYNIAVYANDPATAKPFAERAVVKSNRSPEILDTLGWIEHLLKNDKGAAALEAEALRGAPASSDIQLHAAFIAAALGFTADAGKHLDEAIKHDPSIAKRKDVIELQATLKRPR